MSKFLDYLNESNRGKFISADFFKNRPTSISKILEKIINESATSHALSCDTFFAHSSVDINLVKNIITYFKDIGLKPYIDKDDMELPKYTDIDTAKKLKSNIGACKRFVIVVTDNSINSKWVPWELGVADILKNYENVAILPIESVNMDEKFKGNEYLGIYKQIRERNGKLVVYNPENKETTSIEEWLKE